jgi:hypothetical protein
MTPTMTRCAGVAAALLFLAPACSDDRPSHEAWTKKLKSICAATAQRRETAVGDFDFDSFDPKTSDLAPIVPIIEQQVAIGTEAVDQLDRVRGPKKDEEFLDAHIEAARKVHALGLKEADAARAGDRAEFLKLIGQEDALMSKAPSNEILDNC